MGRYAVTGGCGFIGSHLVEAILDRGDDVVVLDDLSTGKRSNVPATAEVVVGDVTDPAAVGRAIAGADGVFHLAAIASVQRCTDAWRDSHSVNVTGTIAVLEAARDAGRIPVVYASSAAIYGDNTSTPLRETERPLPLTAYGVDKYGSELHAGVAGRIHGVPSFGFRFFNVFGPRQDPSSPYSGVISIFADRMVSGRDITINGDGGQTRDFVYVGDVVEHLLAGMASADTAAPVANVCTGRETSIVVLAETLRGLTDYKGTITHGPARAGDIRISVGDPTFASTRLGCRASVSLADGLAQLLTQKPD
ncbi:NAD-dependent epimerase/dehydratase family protein [Thalassobaculum sp.]|uniref:NAD-dependent epimerase/dehydratase family protein n=1 Tax=Thalassobaculum sp. TaxID=2022740 RepID=UPI0032EEB99A